MEKWKVSQICEKERSRRLLPLSLYPDVSNYAKGRFHSLQTGKWMASSQVAMDTEQNCWVSIPFKRESASQVRSIITECGISLSFHSLQTGKCIASLNLNSQKTSWTFVSIPFKRESASQVFMNYAPTQASQVGFHSLQTGKCIASYKSEILYSGENLGKFPFPSNGKVHRKFTGKSCWRRTKRRFNSLQTGTRITR